MQPDDLITELFDEWAASFARGERPDPRPYLARAGDSRDALSALMERYLHAAPRRAPTSEEVELVAAWMRGDSPLAELRSRRGITRDQVARAIQERFGLRDDQRPAVRDYYHRLEAGLISPRGLSSRLREFLAETFRVEPRSIAGSRPRRPRAATAFRAAVAADLQPQAREAARAPGVEADDEVRALFLSGE